MRSRVTTAVLCALYFSVAVVIGVLHHHEHGGLNDNHQCPACAWQLSGVADTPAEPLVPCLLSIVVATVMPSFRAPVPAALFLPTASRAPPETSA